MSVPLKYIKTNQMHSRYTQNYSLSFIPICFDM